MSEKKTLTIATISAEPKKTQAGKLFWIAVDSEDVEWLCWEEKALADAVRERKLQAVEYEVNISQKGDKTFRSIQGIPGVIEAPKRQGGGGKSFTPRDAWAEERAKYPSFALSYAKDYLIHDSTKTPEDVTKLANTWLNWLVDKQEMLRVSYKGAPTPTQSETPQAAPQPVSQPVPTVEPEEAPVSSDLTEKALKLPLIAKIKELDPSQKHTTHSELRDFPLADLENIHRSLKAEQLAS